MLERLRRLPLFQPIPEEHRPQVHALLCREHFANIRIAIIGLLLAMVLYYILLSLASSWDKHIAWFLVSLGIGIPISVFYFFGENWIPNIKTRLLAANIQAFLIAAAIGYGFSFQTPQLSKTYDIATVYCLIVGVVGAASFTFTANPTTFLIYSLPFLMPLVVTQGIRVEETSGKILALMAIPYTLVLYFLALREYRRRVNLIISETNLKNEQERSQKLLLNILPFDIAAELKSNGKAEPVEYASATVMFTDFVGFTRISETMSPRELIDELDKCFSYFDQVAEKYKLEKLKTIGDSFMCAGGIPKRNFTHMIDCALAAIEIRHFMQQMKEIRESQGHPYWELRIGINSGPIVAGVVGTHKFAYDIWGDTVNTASRMESGGATSKINISATTHDQLRFLFDCESRGKITAKNKGEISMYYLNQIKAPYSINGEGRVPNSKFMEIYERLRNGARLAPKGKPAN